MDMERVHFTNGTFQYHRQQTCQNDGFPCPVHSPSSHHMRHWPLYLNTHPNPGETLVYRVCPHGFAHPDPDQTNWETNFVLGVGEHTCDGCCVAVPLDRIVAELREIERSMR